MSYSKMTDYSYIVYKVTSPTNRIYIGLSKRTLQERKWYHHYEANKKQTKYKFHKAIRKYGDKLKWEILKSGLSKELACRYEIYYIKKYNTYKNGYNLTLGGQTGFGAKFTKQRRKLLSKAAKNMFIERPELRENMSKVQKARLNSPKGNKEHRQLMKKVHGTKEARLRNSKIQGGKPFNVYNFITKQFIKTYEIIQDANNELGLPNGKVSWCLSGKRNHCKTYIFKYIDDPTVNGIEYNHEWDKKIKRLPNDFKRKEEKET